MRGAFSKTHKSTLCIVPPLHIQQAVQRIRCFRDKSFVRWPPHINLLYPFVSEDTAETFADAAATAAHALKNLPPFKVHLCCGDARLLFERSLSQARLENTNTANVAGCLYFNRCT